ncbi:medium-chain acyl-CoA ligase ACSF2, mitochondrial-like [Glandiceps talaboti]
MISVRLPLSSSPQRLRHLLGKLECKALVIGISHIDPVKILQEILSITDMAPESKLYSEELPWLQHIIFMSPIPQPGVVNLEDITKLGNEFGAKDELEKIKMFPTLDDVYTIVFTSGSTGMIPKAVALQNRGLHDKRNSMEYHNGVTMETIKTEGLIFAQVNSVTSGIYSLAEGIMLFLGCSLVFPHPLQTTNALLAAIETEKINAAWFYPMHVEDIINHPNIHQFNLSSLKYTVAVGNVFSPVLLKKLSSILSCEVQQVYGTTEVGTITGHTPNTPLDEKVSNVGFPTFHGEVKITDANDGRIVPIGTIGEVFFRGMAIFSCYWGDEEKTREVKRENGWYYTGDLGKLDARGNLSIIGRKDDMIIKGARNIYPSEIEHALTDHPKIKLRKVVAVPDKRFVHELCLCIVLQDGETATEDGFKEYLKDKVDDYYIPRYVLFMESFPIMTDTGKLNKNQLSILAADKLHITN